jgi:hypothetical protein
MTKPSSMTELEAVNVLLTTIGEAPINTLSGNQVTDVSVARQVLLEVSREVQSQGWHFNTEYNVKLPPDQFKNINIPADAAQIDSEDYNLTIRNGKLYDMNERTFSFNQSVEVTIVSYLDFEELPDAARKYIATRAARIFADRMTNSETLHRMISRDEQQALIDLKSFEGETASHNMMDSYSVARVLNRGHKRILM